MMSFPINFEDTAQRSTARKLRTIHEEDVRIVDGKSDPGAESDPGEFLPRKWDSSIANTALGLTPLELEILRQQQPLAAEFSCNSVRTRFSQPNSGAVSAGSSQGGQGRVFLDRGSLQQFHIHMDHLMRRIQQHHDAVSVIIDFSNRPFTDSLTLSFKTLFRPVQKQPMTEREMSLYMPILKSPV
jgi:hypothetical protein